MRARIFRSTLAAILNGFTTLASDHQQGAASQRRLRYRTIADLRKALTEYRDPLERERNTILGRVSERLRQQPQQR